MGNTLVVFKGKEIRRTLHNDEWWFSVIDVVGVLSESNNPKRYWSDLKRKLNQEAGSSQSYENIVRLSYLLTGRKGRPIVRTQEYSSASSSPSHPPRPS